MERGRPADQPFRAPVQLIRIYHLRENENFSEFSLLGLRKMFQKLENFKVTRGFQRQKNFVLRLSLCGLHILKQVGEFRGKRLLTKMGQCGSSAYLLTQNQHIHSSDSALKSSNMAAIILASICRDRP